ncbi:MAG: type II secretion system F family protein [Armatimonadetes bacterium]|nr:type II secretion system F family protein [Armatimonadota bacterium]
MPFYFYEARDPQGREVEGEAEGPSHRDVSLSLKKLGYEVVSIYERPPRVPVHQSILRAFQRISLFEMSLFTRQLAVMVANGIHVLRALEVLEKQSWSRRLGAAIADVRVGVEKGHGLSGALSARPDVFDQVYTKMVRAGELSGQLDEVMNRLAEFQERDLQLLRRIQSAMTYPILVFLITIFISGFMVAYIFPNFITLFEGMNVELPLVSRILMKLTGLLHDPTILVALLIVVPLVSCQLHGHFSRTAAGNRQWAQLLLSLPMVGKLQRLALAARFCRTQAILLESGVPPLVSLEVSAHAVGNRVLHEAIMNASDGLLNEGLSLVKAIQREKFFPRLCTQMMVAGEQSGTLPRMMRVLADTIETDVDILVTRVVALVEPVMMLIMGIIVGFVLLALFMPVYKLVESL